MPPKRTTPVRLKPLPCALHGPEEDVHFVRVVLDLPQTRPNGSLEAPSQALTDIQILPPKQIGYDIK